MIRVFGCQLLGAMVAVFVLIVLFRESQFVSGREAVLFAAMFGALIGGQIGLGYRRQHHA